MLHILGVDQSLTSSGAACVSSDPEEPPALHRWKPGTKMRGEPRLQWLVDQLEEAAEGCDLVIFEGLAQGAIGSSLLSLAGLLAVMRLRVWQMEIPYVEVSPFSRAKYITGRAGAGKDECLLAVERRFPHAGIDGNDQADALTLAAMGADYYGFPLAKMPESHREALTAIVPAKRGKPAHPAIAWPVLRSGVSAA